MKIYVKLPDELVLVYRPVEAEPAEGGLYRILEQPYDEELEPWEFVPGDVVLCETRSDLEGGIAGDVLVATAKIG